MSLLRFLRIPGSEESPAQPGDSETVRRIAARLDRLPADQARHLASFAYVLARVAHADLEVDANEMAEMERIVGELAHLSDAEAALVVQIAKHQAQHLGGTENYLVTREFRRAATREQRTELLQCVYAVAAADGSITPDEVAEIGRIADELGFTRAEANALRGQFRNQLSIFQAGEDG